MQHRDIFYALGIVAYDETYEPEKTPPATTCPPGSLEKIEVLRNRVGNGEKLWHSDDETRCCRPRTDQFKGTPYAYG